jgi:TonB family protein
MKIIHKALGISILIHLAILASLVVLPSITARKIHAPVYQVSLVTQPEPEQPKPPPKKQAVKPQKQTPPPKKSISHEKKPAPSPKKTKKKEKKKQKPAPERSLADVQRAIDQIKKKMVSKQRIDENRLRNSRVIEAKRSAYFETIAAHIQANWSLLKNEMENVGPLTTDIGLRIRRDGTVMRIVIERPSGDTLFDEFAMRAVKRSAPLPPFPKELKEEKLDVTIGLSS